MLPIVYHNSISPNSTETNFRIDVKDGHYVLRACTFVIDEKTWTIPNDMTFVGDSQDSSMSCDGWLTVKPDGSLALVVMDRSFFSKMSLSSSDDELKQQYYGVVGRNRLVNVFNTISAHHDVASSTSTNVKSLLVSRCLKAGTIPADEVNPAPAFTSTTTPAYEESSSEITYPSVLRSRLNASIIAAASTAALSQKTWDQLNPSEQVHVTRMIAESLGFIKKHPVVSPTGATPSATGLSSPTGSESPTGASGATGP